MRPRPTLVAVVALFLLASGVGGGAAPGDAPQPATGGQIEYDETLLRVDVAADGDAAWTIAYRVSLDDENTSEAFESLRQDIRANRSAFESRFADRLNRTARAAENATGREMAIRNVSVSTGLEVTDTGVVRYTFEWTNFAAVSGEQLRVGDAISGMVLDAETTLFVSWPAAYGVVSISPDADERRDGVAIWNGRETFGTDEPRIVLGRVSTTPTDASETTDGNGRGPGTVATSPGGTDTTGSPAGSGIDPFLLGLAAVLIGVIAVAAWYVTRREGPTGSGAPGSVGSADGNDGSGAVGTGAVGEPDAADEDRDEPPADLLSNEERVLRLLDENGGRMKQQQVVQELDWTDAKTSQVVGTLKEEDDVEVYRIGRENVLALPGETDL